MTVEEEERGEWGGNLSGAPDLFSAAIEGRIKGAMHIFYLRPKNMAYA